MNNNNKSYNLFLDDIRHPYDVAKYIYPTELIPLYTKEKWKIVRNYNEFVKCITKNGIPLIVSFDHDLSDEHYRESMYAPDGRYNKYYTDGTFKEKTGYCCAKWFIEYVQNNSIKELPKIVCHSMNPIGKKNIITLFENFVKHLKK